MREMQMQWIKDAISHVGEGKEFTSDTIFLIIRDDYKIRRCPTRERIAQYIRRVNGVKCIRIENFKNKCSNWRGLRVYMYKSEWRE